MGSFWDRLQTFTPYEGTLHWKPKHHTHPWVQAVCSIVSTCIDLLNMTKEPEDIVFSLYVYFDAHVPLMCAIEDATEKSIRQAFHKYQPKTQDVYKKATYQISSQCN